MRLRGLLIGVIALAAAAGAGTYLAWPLLSARLAGALADRLGRETGLRWQVGALALDPAPGLVLQDVTVSGEGLSGRLRRVRVTGPLGLLLGGDGTVEAAIEDARLSLPLAIPGEGAQRNGDGGRGEAPGVRALRAVLRGTDAAAADGTLALAAGSAALALDLARDAAGRDPSLRIELPDLGAVAEVAAGAPSAARAVRLSVAPAGGPPVSATATARRDARALRLDAIAGTIDRAPFSGSLAAEATGPGGRPRLALDLRLDALSLAEPGAQVRADPAAGITVPVRADRLPDPAWFSGFDARASLAIGRLSLGPVRASGVTLGARVADGRLDATLDGATLYGGSATGSYGLEPDGRSGRHRIGLALAGVRVLPLMQDVAGVSGLDGTGSARLDVQARGATPDALLRSATGRAEVSAVDGRIDGLDLARAAGLTGMGGGLATRLDRLGAHFALGGGRATTQDLRLETGLIRAEGGGEIDLVARTLDIALKPLRVTAGGRFDVPIRISGPWDGPAVSADVAGLARDPAGAIQGLQNLGSEILGGRGDDLGQGLGGLLEGLMPRRDRAPSRRP